MVDEEGDSQEVPSAEVELPEGEGIELEGLDALADLLDSVSEEDIAKITEEVEESSPQYELDIPGYEISVDIEDELRGWNKEFELVSGEENSFGIRFENVSEEEFPGAELTEIQLRGPSGVMGYSETVEVPNISPGEIEVVEFPVRVTIEGSCGVHARIEVNDGGDVLVDGVEENELNEALRAVPRERLQMVSKLSEIQEILENE